MDIGKYNRKDNKTHSLLRLDRTFPNHKMFVTGSANQLVLFRILAAYYLYNTTIGYCQGKDMIPFSGCTSTHFTGMAYIVALLLMNLRDEEVLCDIK